MVGDVDAGKSTILGRLLVDRRPSHAGEACENSNRRARKRGVPIEYSFLLDAFQVERDQAITLDVSRVWVRTRDADFVFVDAPGHRELIRNLLSGASEVDAPVMVVAADEGITPQTRGKRCSCSGLAFATSSWRSTSSIWQTIRTPQFERRAERSARISRVSSISLPHEIVPVAARTGDNIVNSGSLTSWWNGPTLLAGLKRLERREQTADGPLRFLVQDVYRREGTRLIVGRVESGALRRAAST